MENINLVLLLASSAVVVLSTIVGQREINRHKAVAATLVRKKFADLEKRFEVTKEVNRWTIRGMLIEGELYIRFYSEEEVRECAEALGLKLGTFTYSPEGTLVIGKGLDARFERDLLRRTPFSAQISYDLLSYFIQTSEGEIE